MDDKRDELTARDIEVLALLAAGQSQKQTAKMLGLAHSTVSNHVSTILLKLRAHNITEAVALAIARGIVTAPTIAPPEDQ